MAKDDGLTIIGDGRVSSLLLNNFVLKPIEVLLEDRLFFFQRFVRTLSFTTGRAMPSAKPPRTSKTSSRFGFFRNQSIDRFNVDRSDHMASLN